jgi:activator of HSP90 ATPase
MKRMRLFTNNEKCFAGRSFSRIAVLIMPIFFLQLSPMAQNMQNTMSEKKTADTSITIHQEIDFKASPQQIYTALLDDQLFSKITAQMKGFPAKSATIDSSAGGTFSLFGGHIIGRNLELVPNQRIVQAWRVVDWPAGVYSIVRFELKPQGAGTHLFFDHVGFPKGLHDHLAEGWQGHYWDLLSEYFK